MTNPKAFIVQVKFISRNMKSPIVLTTGASLDSASIYTDINLTKKDVAEVLNTSRPTVVRLEKITFYGVADFKEDYPILNGKRDRQSVLTPYQVWILSRAFFLMKSFKDSKRVLDYIIKKPESFSRALFGLKYKQIYKKGA